MSRVPSKIVIAGNSKMTLNERFANLPKKRPIRVAQPKQVVQSRPLRQRPAYQPVAEEVFEEIEYVIPQKTKPIRRTPKRIVQQQPIEHRLSIPAQRPKVVYVPMNPRIPARNNAQFQNKKFNNFAAKKQNFVRNNTKTFVRRQPTFAAKNGFKPNVQHKKTFQKPLANKKTVEELDKELDQYMRKSKHTPIKF